MNRNDSGTPQGGVVSPLLANIFLHWFDKVFYSATGPGTWAGAKLVRYCDDFVILVRYLSPRIQQYVKDKIENWMGLKLNQEKTRVVDMSNEKTSFTFLGYSFSYIPRRNKWRGKYCYLRPSDKSVQRARDRIREFTSIRYSFCSPENVVERVNLYLRGWGSDFCKGAPSKMFNRINYFVGYRLIRFLRRKSQRGYKLGAEENWYKLFTRLGIVRLRKHLFITKA